MNNKQKLDNYINNDVKNLGLDSRTQTLVQVLLMISYNLGYEQALSMVNNALRYYEETDNEND